MFRKGVVPFIFWLAPGRVDGEEALRSVHLHAPQNDLSPIGQEPLLIYKKDVVTDLHDTQHGNHLEHVSAAWPAVCFVPDSHDC